VAVLDLLAAGLRARDSSTLARVRASACAARGYGFAISTVTCRDDHTRWSPPEVRDGYNLVLARRGRFRRRADGVEDDIDPTVAYLSGPETEEQFAHPAGGDVCTWIKMEPQAWSAWTGTAAPPALSAIYVDAQRDLAHRRLLAATRSGDVDYAVAQSLLYLIGGVLQQLDTDPEASQRPASRRERAVVAAAREAILAAHPAAHALLPLAASLAISPFRLSRAFTREMGVSLTHYRNRVRVARALDRLEYGENNLALLAADLGFADQGHLCRTVRQHLGHTPTAVRRMLRPTPPN
jgi:AraC-like DNA-binding protein